MERDRQPLGGQRPSNHDSLSPSREVSDDSDADDDDLIEAVNDGPHERVSTIGCFWEGFLERRNYWIDGRKSDQVMQRVSC